ncbi:MAG: peroxidase [Planctomycetota bacterium]|nr:MAG: peroxidase [Planctomycetota bacterium]
MEAHAFDLRAEVGDDEWVQAFKTDYRQARLSDVDRALCDFALKLTRIPADVTQEDIDDLRSRGLSDRAINDAVQVVSFFNYINRIADGLGVDLEPGM